MFAFRRKLGPAALAHFWFVTLHPSEDCNGRIARAIADLLLARSDGSPQRFYSMSAQIRNERKKYYAVLESTQKGDLDITAWLLWFFDCLRNALLNSEHTLAAVLHKHRFWTAHARTILNPRQVKVLNRLLDGFSGKPACPVGRLTTTKWARLTKSSPDTALHYIQDLMKKGVLEKGDEGGLSSQYVLVKG
ncbi:MAG: Fic family protein [Flavobacteriales bacterium]|nr:Fic family protein [Flavobacteriales bacterium]